jgi:hypothetical protein
MRNVSKNRFSRVVIKKSPYINSVSVMKSNISDIKTDASQTVIKPAKGAVSTYDRRIIAGSAL